MFLLLFIINNVSYGTCVTQDDAQDYGIDWDEVVPSADTGSVEVPLTHNPLSDENYARLCRAFNPLNINSECDSVDVFCAVNKFMYSLMS